MPSEASFENQLNRAVRNPHRHQPKRRTDDEKIILSGSFGGNAPFLGCLPGRK